MSPAAVHIDVSTGQERSYTQRHSLFLFAIKNYTEVFILITLVGQMQDRIEEICWFPGADPKK